MSRRALLVADVVAVLIALVVFVIPFVFILLTAVKSEEDARDLAFALPKEWSVWQNVVDVFAARDGILITAFKNSAILTVASVTVLVIIGSMVAFVLQRRMGRVAKIADMAILAGLIIPPAIVPTIWVLQGLHLFKSLPGLILVEVALTLPFTIMLFRAFIASIPREIDEAAIIDGASPLGVYFRVIFPLLRPVIVTVIITTSVFVFNDFVNPLYFTPGDENATVQLTLYNFLSQFRTQYNLLFMDILIITVPPLVLFLFFNKKIVGGMTAGSVKG